MTRAHCSLPAGACLLLALACSPRGPTSRAFVTYSERAKDVPQSDTEPDRGGGLGGLRALEVPGFGSALFYAPGGSEILPLIVAAHGAGGAPDWECDYWRRLSSERAFILCLRGTPLGSYSGFFYRDHLSLEREFLSAERAARAAEPRIALGHGLYAGFSQGATMGSAMIGKHGRRFPYLVLIEGFDPWNVPRARAFARASGQRVLIACGSKECAKVGAASVRWLETGGVSARLAFAPGAGHTPAGEVMEQVEGALEWLLAGDSLWH